MKRTAFLAVALALSAPIAWAKKDKESSDDNVARAQVEHRLDEIWDAFAHRDLVRLRSYHLYGPGFTSFKDGGPREDAKANEEGEAMSATMIGDPKVDMRRLSVQVYGDVAIATFDGHFMGTIEGAPVAVDQQSTLVLLRVDDDWRIVHEHFSPLGAMSGP